MKLLKQLEELLALKLETLTVNLSLLEKELDKKTNIDLWNLKTGENFNNLMDNYPITEEELLSISKTVCEFVWMTRITNIDKYLFVNGDFEQPRLPYKLK